jgi:hypothetical protein
MRSGSPLARASVRPTRGVPPLRTGPQGAAPRATARGPCGRSGRGLAGRSGPLMTCRSGNFSKVPDRMRRRTWIPASLCQPHAPRTNSADTNARRRHEHVHAHRGQIRPRGRHNGAVRGAGPVLRQPSRGTAHRADGVGTGRPVRRSATRARLGRLGRRGSRRVRGVLVPVASGPLDREPVPSGALGCRGVPSHRGRQPAVGRAVRRRPAPRPVPLRVDHRHVQRGSAGCDFAAPGSCENSVRTPSRPTRVTRPGTIDVGAARFPPEEWSAWLNAS